MFADFENPKAPNVSRFPGGFRALVARELAAMGYTVVKWHADGLDCAAQNSPSNFISLTNLYRRVKSSDPAESESIIRHFIASLLQEMSGGNAMPETMEAAAPNLLVRIGQPFSRGIKPPWFKKLPGTDLHLNMVIDYPKTMAYVTTELMDKSPTPSGDWLDRAVKNLRDRTPADCLDLVRADEGLYCIHTNDAYDASRAMILNELTGNDPAGWLIALPARDWLFGMKVERKQLAYLHILKYVAQNYHKKQPYPITQDIYWLRPGRAWVPIPVEIRADGIQVHPPEEFFLTIAGLAPGAETPAEEPT